MYSGMAKGISSDVKQQKNQARSLLRESEGIRQAGS